MNLYNIPINTIENKRTTLQAYKGQVMLIVNVASRCGFTSQYKLLEALYQDLKARGFIILAFPCNQFLRQEPEDNRNILNYVTECFHVSFPVFAKMDVRGTNQSLLYRYLSQNIMKKTWPFIPWNFTKILIDKHGHILKRYWPTVSIDIIRREIEELLNH